MTNKEIDSLWYRAMNESVRAGEDFTRYRFAHLVAEREREACAVICDEEAKWASSVADRDGAGAAVECGYKIRARGK